MRYLADMSLPPPGCEVVTDERPDSDLVTGALDEETAIYVATATAPFDKLREAAAQLAGLLVLTVTGSRDAPAHPGLALAASACAEAEDSLGRVVLTPRAERHYRHMLLALDAITVALAAAGRLSRHDESAVDAALKPLRVGYSHLQSAARSLPGFEIVAFEQGCCARHRGLWRVGRSKETVGG